MAVELLADLLGEALEGAAGRHSERWAQTKASMLEWLREAAQPPSGVELKTADGATYTGFIVVDRNELVMMLAVRHPTGPLAPPNPPTMISPAPRNAPPPYRGFPDPDDPVWDRDPSFHR